MAYDLKSITSEARVRAPRIILLGVEKIGKSTFAAGADNPIFLPIKGEEGIDEIPVPQVPTCNSTADVSGWLCTFGREEHSHQTVVIDSIRWICQHQINRLKLRHNLKAITVI